MFFLKLIVSFCNTDCDHRRLHKNIVETKIYFFHVYNKEKDDFHTRSFLHGRKNEKFHDRKTFFSKEKKHFFMREKKCLGFSRGNESSSVSLGNCVILNTGGCTRTLWRLKQFCHVHNRKKTRNLFLQDRMIVFHVTVKKNSDKKYFAH